MLERQKALRLLRYRHQKGEKAVVHRQAKSIYEAKKTEALEKRKSSRPTPDGESDKISFGDSDSDDEIKSPYQFLQQLTKKEAQKREAWLSNFSTDSSNVIKGSLASSSSTSTSSSPSVHNFKSCAYVSVESGSIRCPNQAVPCSEYCQAHILVESGQVLFTTCNRPLSDGIESCKTPIIKSLDRYGCLIHKMAQVKKYREPEDIKLNRRKLISELPKAGLEEEKEVLENLIAKETFSISHFDDAVRRIGIPESIIDTDDSDEDDSDGDCGPNDGGNDGDGDLMDLDLDQADEMSEENIEIKQEEETEVEDEDDCVIVDDDNELELEDLKPKTEDLDQDSFDKEKEEEPE